MTTSHPRPLRAIAPLVLALSLGCAPFDEPASAWFELFNGQDLTGWTPKVTGFEPGEDPLETFHVKDGLLTVGYDNYDTFENRFGHLFYKAPFSHYELLVEYRFVGTQVPEGPEWAFKNSGVMFHAQSPQTMLRDQDFPVSLEVQFLGGSGSEPRPTSNLCTPGTHVEMGGEQIVDHCVPAAAPTFHGEEWVAASVIVLGDSLVHHVVAGDTVLTYSAPVVGGGEVNGYDPSAKPDGARLSEGYLALQSES
ncbi:MAG: 3-keto-disaccharide hydrolase, partial [Longimicrobiales bacterium]